MNKWKTTCLVVNDNKGSTYEYTLNKESIADLIDALAHADQMHPSATSMMIVLVKQLRVIKP